MAKRRCPKCGSTDVKRWGVPQTWSKWECRNCGYIGALVIEDGKSGFRDSGSGANMRDQYEEMRKRGRIGR